MKLLKSPAYWARSVAKHKLKGFGKAGALLVFTQLAGTPMFFLTTGVLGKITFFFLQKIMSGLASKGLVVLNVGVDLLATAGEKKKFDSAIEEALNKIKNSKKQLTMEEKNAIDEPVRKAFRKFASLV